MRTCVSCFLFDARVLSALVCLLFHLVSLEGSALLCSDIVVLSGHLLYYFVLEGRGS